MNKTMTTKEKLEKILYYRDHILDFIENEIKLEEIGGVVPFKIYDKQRQVVEDFLNYHNLLFVKSRQIGISTITQAIIVSVITLFPNVTAGVISKDGAEATDFVKKTKSMIENLDEWIRPKFQKKLEQDVILTNGSRIVSATVNAHKPSTTFRGKSLAILVVDEAAFIDYIDEAYTSMMPAVSKVQKVAKEKGIPYGTFIISTPNKTVGIGKWYFDKYKLAERGKSIFKLVKIHWSEVEGCDEEWYRDQCDLLENDENKIAQELEMKFISSRGSIFSTEIQKALQNPDHYLKGQIETFFVELKRDNKIVAKEEFKLETYKSFNTLNMQKQYLISVDTATKRGVCQSAITIWDRMTMDLIALYTGDTKVSMFTEFIKKLMDFFPNCIAIIENNSYGNQIVEELDMLHQYSPKLYYTKRKLSDNKIKLIPGLETTGFTRPLMMDALINFVKERYNTIYSESLALQLVGLEEDRNGKIKHGNKTIDDLVMTMAFVCYVLSYNLLPDFSLTIDQIQDMYKIMTGEEADNSIIENDNSPLTDDEMLDAMNKLLF